MTARLKTCIKCERPIYRENFCKVHWNEEQGLRQVKRKENPSKASAAISSLLAVFIGGSILAVAVYYLAWVQLGIDPDAKPTQAQSSQLSFWFLVWETVVLLVLLKLLKRSDKPFYHYSRWLLLVFTPILLIVLGFNFIDEYKHSVDTNRAEASCNISQQLNKATQATYSISGSQGDGSAFAINSKGTLLTAYHVIEDNNDLHTWITSSAGKVEQTPVTIVKTSPTDDLALLSINAPTQSYLPLTTASEGLVGQDVFAVGFPANFFQGGRASVTKGVFSRLITHADIPDIPNDLSFIQTDAALNPGNSGGPLISSCGAIGVNDAVSPSFDIRFSSTEGIGYAVSTDTAKKALGL